MGGRKQKSSEMGTETDPMTWCLEPGVYYTVEGTLLAVHLWREERERGMGHCRSLYFFSLFFYYFSLLHSLCIN